MSLWFYDRSRGAEPAELRVQPWERRAPGRAGSAPQRGVVGRWDHPREGAGSTALGSQPRLSLPMPLPRAWCRSAGMAAICPPPLTEELCRGCGGGCGASRGGSPGSPAHPGTAAGALSPGTAPHQPSLPSSVSVGRAAGATHGLCGRAPGLGQEGLQGDRELQP